MIDGLMNIEHHQVPLGSLVLEMKLCENCSCPFVRARKSTVPFEARTIYDDMERLRRDINVRYCKRCQWKALTPVDLSEYKEQFPGTENQMRHSIHLPKYDMRSPVIERRGWVARVVAAIELDGPLSIEKIGMIADMKTTSVRASVKHHRYTLLPVASLYPRKSCMGPALKLYVLKKDFGYVSVPLITSK